jgi:hypothetical protein
VLVVLTLCGGDGSASFVTKPDLMLEPHWHVLADMRWMVGVYPSRYQILRTRRALPRRSRTISETATEAKAAR